MFFYDLVASFHSPQNLGRSRSAGSRLRCKMTAFCAERKEYAMRKKKNAKIANVQTPAPCPQISTDLLRLTEQYRRDEENITRQIEKLRARIKQRPEPHELEQLEFRIDVLLCERRELRAAADHMLRLAAPPPLSPSLLARERGAS